MCKENKIMKKSNITNTCGIINVQCFPLDIQANKVLLYCPLLNGGGIEKGVASAPITYESFMVHVLNHKLHGTT